MPSFANDPALDVFQLDPSLFRWGYGRATPARRLLIAVPIGLFLIIAVAALEGNLLRSGVPLSAGFEDLWSLTSHASAFRDPVFPLSRDLPSILAMMIALATPALVYRQWIHYTELLRETTTDPNLFSFSDQRDETAFHERLQNLARKLQVAGGWAPVRMAVSFVLALALLRAARSGGIFNAFYPEVSHLTRSNWRSSAYENWWLNFDSGSLAAIAFTVIAAIFIYYLLLQNELNARVLAIFLPFRGKFLCGFDQSRPHQEFGWISLRRVLTLGVICLALDGALLYYVLLITPRALFVWLLPLTLLYSIAVPAFGIVPHLIFTPARKRAKANAIESLRPMLASSSGAERHRIVTEINELENRVRDTIFNLRYLFIGIVPAILGVLSFAHVVWQVLK